MYFIMHWVQIIINTMRLLRSEEFSQIKMFDLNKKHVIVIYAGI